jgi:signal peptidase I
MNFFKKVIEYTGWLFLGIIMATTAFVYLAAGRGWEFDAVLSGSMEPVYNVGGLVIIKPASASEVNVGDAISFKLPGMNTPICHRIIGVEIQDGARFFQTKGDANEGPDAELVPGTSVTGKAIYHIPYVGRLGEVRNLGATKIVLLGRSLPAATLVIFPLGLLFIGLTLKDAIEDTFYPWKKQRRESVKIRKDRLLSRKKLLRLK